MHAAHLLIFKNKKSFVKLIYSAIHQLISRKFCSESKSIFHTVLQFFFTVLNQIISRFHYACTNVSTVIKHKGIDFTSFEFDKN